MMTVKMTVPMTGPKIARNRGDVVDFSDKEAQRLIKAGFAVPYRAPKVENATDKTIAETAAK